MNTKEITNYVLKGDKDNNKKLVGYAESFEDALIELTDSDDVLEAFSKIEPLYESDEMDDFCICSHPIYYRFFVKNTETDEIYTIGEDCIHKFERYKIVESGKFNNFIKYADSILYLRKKVREVLKNNDKLYTLNRTKIEEHINACNLKTRVPKEFYQLSKSEYAKYVGAKLIIELCDELKIKSDKLDELIEWSDNYLENAKEKQKKSIADGVKNIVKYPHHIYSMNILIEKQSILDYNCDITIPEAYNDFRKPKCLAKIDNFNLLKLLAASLGDEDLCLDEISKSISNTDEREKTNTKQLYHIWKAICSKSDKIESIKRDIEIVNADREYFKTTKKNRKSPIKHEILRYQSKDTLSFFMDYMKKN